MISRLILATSRVSKQPGPRYRDVMADAILVTVGERIRELRRQQGKLQEEVATEAGMNRAYYNRVERGSQNLALLSLARIAAALGTDMASILADVPTPDDPDAQTA